MLAGDLITFYDGSVKVNQIKANKLNFMFTKESNAF